MDEEMTGMVLPQTGRNGLVVAALVIVVLQAIVPPAGAVWTNTTVDSIGAVGLYPSLAVGADGYPRISYVDATNTNLMYTAWNGAGWDISTVAGIGDGDGTMGGYPSLALDPAGNPRISYVNSTTASLNYAVWTGSGWTTETVDSSSLGIAAYTSLALNASGYPGISYQGIANDLKYAAWNGASWDIRTVDSTGDNEVYSSLALDSSGSPRISYLNMSGMDASVNYAAWNGVGWDIRTVDTAENTIGSRTSLALDLSGNPRISYLRSSNDLRYASWNGTSWDSATVENAGFPVFSSLALDGSGNPRISYYSITNEALKYAEWNGASWTLTTVDTTANVGYSSSLALDRSGYPRIGYLDVTNYDLKYAARDPLTADFSATPVMGAAPLGVIFEASAANGTPLSWKWYFGDGGMASVQNPAHTFEHPGTFVVFLIADSADETFTKVRADYITVDSGSTGTAAAIAVDPAQPATVYTGIDGSGVYRTTNGGTLWLPATTQPGNTQIRALVINPVAHSRLFTGTYGGGVYQSTDSGDHWNTCSNTGLANLNVLSLVSDVNGRLYAGTENGVYTSTDNCTSWAAVNGGLP
jgi:PKD repeat protein